MTTLQWNEGDLLYGCNNDRTKLAELTGKKDFFKIGDMRLFTTLFADIKDEQPLPKIIDQYHDFMVLKNQNSNVENSFEKFHNITNEYSQQLQANLAKLNNSKSTQEYNEELWAMCLKGLEFFIYQKQATIHFVINTFNNTINLAT